MFSKKQKKSLGVADDAGVFVATPEGEALEKLTEFYRKIFNSIPGITKKKTVSDWDLTPLGAPGKLRLPKDFQKKPVFKKIVKKTPGMVILSGNTQAVIVVPAGDKVLKALANELKYHLDTMTGRSFSIFNTAPAAGPAIIFGKLEEIKSIDADCKSVTPGTVVIKRKKDHVFIGGYHSLGLTYVLEALGCRYLWPGPGGKVIPRKTEVVLPEISLVNVPKLKIRTIRALSYDKPRWADSFRRLGMNNLEEYRRFMAASVDHPGNRSFFAWHGINDKFDSEGQHCKRKIRWGHSFNDFYDRVGKKHPEFFALQPDGSRKQVARPALCLSNSGLIDFVARERIQMLNGPDKLQGVSICLNDGGYNSECMCSHCRRLDPENAPPAGILLFKPKRCFAPYVSRTDRVLYFSNRVAEKVAAACPGKQLTFYAYSSYNLPPVSLRPHPSLIILSVLGDYTSDAERTKGMSTLAAWSSFGNPLLWRPNALRGDSNMLVPQNYGRKIFEDVEKLKANGLMGTDFDCYERLWAIKGLIYYTLCKSLWNPDQLDYDTYFDDYCKSGFGEAADVIAAYFNEVEKISNRAAADAIPLAELWDAGQVARLGKLLEQAMAKTTGDREIADRIKFLEVGLKYADFNCRLNKAQKENSPEYAKMQKELVKFIQEQNAADPVAMNPYTLGFLHPHVPR